MAMIEKVAEKISSKFSGVPIMACRTIKTRKNIPNAKIVLLMLIESAFSIHKRYVKGNVKAATNNIRIKKKKHILNEKIILLKLIKSAFSIHKRYVNGNVKAATHNIRPIPRNK